MVQQTQVTIIGAGIGGCVAALALAPFYSVLLIDPFVAPAAKVGECLPAAAERVLYKLGLESILATGHLAHHGLLSYWESKEPVILDQLTNPDGLGWHVDRQLFELQLRDAATNRGVTCLWPASFIKGEPTVSGWHLVLEHQGKSLQVQSELVIDASGRHSVFAKQQGALRKNHDLQVSAWLSANVKVRKQISVLSRTSSGWWYSAPLPKLPLTEASGICNEVGSQARLFCWQVNPSQLDKKIIQSSTEFLHAAASVTGMSTLVEQIIPVSAQLHGVVAANSARLTEAWGHHWFAVGDAALSFDPLSSQGMLNAMATAMQLADLLNTQGLHHSATAPTYQKQLDSIWQYYLAHKQHFMLSEQHLI